LSDVYFIGVRVKPGVEIKPDKIDLTGTRQRFFDSLDENLRTGKNETIENLIKQKFVDIKIEYRQQNELPIEVRPKKCAQDAMLDLNLLQ